MDSEIDRENIELESFIMQLRQASIKDTVAMLSKWIKELEKKHEYLPKNETVKIEIPHEVLETNKKLPSLSKEEEVLNLGTIKIEEQQYTITRKSYFHESQLKNNFSSYYAIEYCLGNDHEQNVAEISIMWDEGTELPINVHRKVNSKYRGKGLGQVLLTLSEQVLGSMGFRNIYAESSKPASVAWFLKNGYTFRDKEDINIDVLSQVASHVSDYSKVFARNGEKKVFLAKELN